MKQVILILLLFIGCSENKKVLPIEPEPIEQGRVIMIFKDTSLIVYYDTAMYLLSLKLIPIIPYKPIHGRQFKKTIFSIGRQANNLK